LDTELESSKQASISVKKDESNGNETKRPQMEYRMLGNSGLKVSALSLGSWVTYGHQVQDLEVVSKCMHKAYNAGVNFFDCAEAYASGEAEVLVGEVLKRSGWRRSDLVISTKIFWGGPGQNELGLSRKHIIEGTNAALKRLQLDYVDLIYCHRPDLLTPIEETVRAMNHVINQGKALYWGTSEWTAAQIAEAVGIAKDLKLIAPLMEQPEYSLFTRDRVEKEYVPLYASMKLGLTTWSPLASGILTGKYNNGYPKGTRFHNAPLEPYFWLRKLHSDEASSILQKVEKFQGIAKELGATSAQLAIAWCLKNAHVSTVITGASKPEQVDENMAALALVPKLSASVMEAIETIFENKPQQDATFGREK